MLPLVHNKSRADGTYGSEVKLSQCSYVDLHELITNHVKSHIENNTFITNHPVIPNDELYIKIGGDKGGGSMKFTFQIMNVQNPNSRDNTIIFNLFEAPDTYSNIKQALHFNLEQINQLEGSIIEGKVCRVFVTGDYSGLTTFYGLSGASGLYFCLFCLCSSRDRHLQPSDRDNNSSPSAPRTVESIQYYHQCFVNAGSNLAKAKEFYNCINAPLFTIPIYRVCPPVLHLSLGIYLKLFKLLEDACASLDFLIFKARTDTDTGINNGSVNAAIYKSRHQAIVSVQDQLYELEEEASMVSDLILHTCNSNPSQAEQPPIVGQLQNDLRNIEDKIKQKVQYKPEMFMFVQ